MSKRVSKRRGGVSEYEEGEVNERFMNRNSDIKKNTEVHCVKSLYS